MGPNCDFLHICKKCGSPDHPYQTCPEKPVPKTYVCEVCGTTMVGELDNKLHFDGKRHQKNIKKRNFKPLQCKICDKTLDHELAYELHMKSKAHIKKKKKEETGIRPHCDICDLDLAANITEQNSHYNGKRQAKNVRKLEATNSEEIVLKSGVRISEEASKRQKTSTTIS